MTGPGRIAWIDVAKAVCIVLVVLYHARHAASAITWGDVSATPFWWLAGAALRPFRMPVFFLMSGLLAASAIHHPWRKAAPGRVVRLLRVYGVWALLFAIVLPGFPDGGFGFAPAKLLGLLLGQSILWYLWALAVFFALTWVTREAPRGLLLIGVVIAACGASLIPGLSADTQAMLRCMMFFFLGARFRPEILRLAEAANVPRLLMALLATTAVLLLSWNLGSAFNPLLDIAGAVTGVFAAVLFARNAPLAVRLARPLTARTLPIYVLHFPLIVMGVELAKRMPEPLTATPGIGLMFPALLCLAAVGLSVLLAKVVERLNLAKPLFGADRSSKPPPAAAPVIA